MVTRTLPQNEKKKRPKNGSQPERKDPFKTKKPNTREFWPDDIEDAYRRDRGPYTIANAITLIEEEPLELFNGWLVWQEMTNAEERRIAANIQEILSLVARACDFGQAYPDQFECKMVNEDVFKPDVCVLSNERYEQRVEPALEGSDHLMLSGSPELVIEIRSPSNRRAKERLKRKSYFESGAVVIWDVDHKKRKIWVYEVTNPEKGTEYSENDQISCPQLLPNWKRKVSDFFAKNLSAEEIAGQVAAQWRSDERDKTLREMLLRQARRRFGIDQLPAELETKLAGYSEEQLTELGDTLAITPGMEEWLKAFPV
jgi:Uma2 family endonuclease